MSDKNMFGGGNPDSLYVPMSDDEYEVLHLLVESQTLRVLIHPWNIVCTPSKVIFGDKRIAVNFEVQFNSPEIPIPVKSFDLELQGLGTCLLRKPYPTFQGDGSPLLVGGGLSLSLQWDIAIDHMNPKLVKALRPAALGLTSRRIDKDTGERTLIGNMKLDGLQKKTLTILEGGEKKVRGDDAAAIEKVTSKPR